MTVAAGGFFVAQYSVDNALARGHTGGPRLSDTPAGADYASRDVQKDDAQKTDTISVGNPLEEGFGGPQEGRTKKGLIEYFQGRLAGLLNIMFGLLGVLSLIPIVFGGIQLIMSQGSSDKVEKGKKALFWGIAGLVLAFSVLVIINFLLGVILPKGT